MERLGALFIDIRHWSGRRRGKKNNSSIIRQPMQINKSYMRPNQFLNNPPRMITDPINDGMCTVCDEEKKPNSKSQTPFISASCPASAPAAPAPPPSQGGSRPG
jgi:hypothetical protein